MAQRLDVRYITCYTDGSAAREVALVEPFHTLKLPRVKKQKRLVLHVDPIAICGIVLSLVLIVSMIVGAVQLDQARREATRMEAYVQTLRQENQELTQKYRDGIDMEHVMQTARALGLVPVEQVKHITIRFPEEVQPQQQLSFWEQVYT
jgi:cell division protein FtsL